MLKLEIHTSNAAFDPDPRLEVARILKQAAVKIASGRVGGYLFDLNGNHVGRFDLIPEGSE